MQLNRWVRPADGQQDDGAAAHWCGPMRRSPSSSPAQPQLQLVIDKEHELYGYRKTSESEAYETLHY
jgi:hypothetical protein